MFLYLALAVICLVGAVVAFIRGAHPAIGCFFLLMAGYDLVRWWSQYSYRKTLSKVREDQRKLKEDQRRMTETESRLSREPDRTFDFTGQANDEKPNDENAP
jgi:hypothetical protein